MNKEAKLGSHNQGLVNVPWLGNIKDITLYKAIIDIYRPLIPNGWVMFNGDMTNDPWQREATEFPCCTCRCHPCHPCRWRQRQAQKKLLVRVRTPLCMRTAWNLSTSEILKKPWSNIHGISMVYPWYIHGISMVYPWYMMCIRGSCIILFFYADLACETHDLVCYLGIIDNYSMILTYSSYL